MFRKKEIFRENRSDICACMTCTSELRIHVIVLRDGQRTKFKFINNYAENLWHKLEGCCAHKHTSHTSHSDQIQIFFAISLRIVPYRNRTRDTMCRNKLLLLVEYQQMTCSLWGERKCQGSCFVPGPRCMTISPLTQVSKSIFWCLQFLIPTRNYFTQVRPLRWNSHHIINNL